MIKMSTCALLATSFVATFGGTGCSSTLKKPSDEAVKVRKASLISTADSNQSYFIKTAYHRSEAAHAKATVDEDFDTWDRIYSGFKLSPQMNRPQVQYFVNYYGQNPEQLTMLSERASLFLHMIVHEVDRRKMPTELALLPFVESAFDPDIFSHAGAAGLWQFIPDTGKRYGLKQNKKYDARMDPFAATGAALNYLEKLHNDFNGDWLLALAAYNCGEGRVQKEIERNQARGLPTTFWDLNLPRETKEYVPRLLAFRELIGHANHYGITLADTPNRARLAQLKINKAVNLREAALAAGLEENQLVELNPYFRTGVTTPKYSNRIILPREHASLLAKVIEMLPPADEPKLIYASHKAHRYNTLPTTHFARKSTKGSNLYAKAKTKTKIRTAERNHDSKVRA